jgi:transcriptional regulator with XRE-family HTH domain
MTGKKSRKPASKKTEETPKAATSSTHHGAKIRRLRKLEGKSLRALADELGISPSALSMIENGRSGVSLQRLQLIADHFGVPIVELLAEHAERQTDERGIRIIRQLAASAPSVQRGKGVTYQVPAVGARRAMQPAMVTFAPGAGYLGDPIGHEGEEAVFVMLGQVELHRGAKKVVLSQGDAALFSSGEPHAFRNASEEGTAVILIIATPPW